MIRFHRSWMMLAAVASLAACNAPGGSVAGPGSTPPIASPSPIATPPGSAAAEAIGTAFKALDTARSAVDVLLATGQIVPGTPRALAIAEGLRVAKVSLQSASAIERRGGDVLRLMTLMDQAGDAMRSVTALLSGDTGAVR